MAPTAFGGHLKTAIEHQLSTGEHTKHIPHSRALDVGPDAGRIIGGNPTAPWAYPWLIVFSAFAGPSSVHWPSHAYCGGSLIAPDVVLTAAHCVFNGAGNYHNTANTAVGVSQWDLGNPGGNPCTKNLGVQKIVAHPDYSPSTLSNDVALLFLKEAAPCADQEGHVAAWDDDPAHADTSTWDDEVVTVAGWGSTKQYDGGENVSPNYPDKLHEATVTVMSNLECVQNTNYGNWHISDPMICAASGVGEVAKDACQGDSGGPLFVPDGAAGGKPLVIGVVSWGIGCADEDYAGVYHRVASAVTWIKDTMEGGGDGGGDPSAPTAPPSSGDGPTAPSAPSAPSSGDDPSAPPSAPPPLAPPSLPPPSLPPPSLPPDDVIVCAELNKKKCKKEDDCEWDTSEKICYSQETPPEDVCEGTSKKKCKKLDGCKWDNKDKQCVEADGDGDGDGCDK